MFGFGGAKPAAAAGAGAAAPAAAPSTAIVDITDKVDKKGSFLLNGAGTVTAGDCLGGVVVHSDAGPQLIFHLPFVENVKVHSIVITPANDAEAPVVCKLFVNKTAFGFDDAESGEEVQEVKFASAAEAGKEFKVKAAKFANTYAVSIFLDGGDSRDVIGVQRIKIMGCPVMKADVSKINKNC